MMTYRQWLKRFEGRLRSIEKVGPCFANHIAAVQAFGSYGLLAPFEAVNDYLERIGRKRMEWTREEICY